MRSANFTAAADSSGGHSGGLRRAWRNPGSRRARRVAVEAGTSRHAGSHRRHIGERRAGGIELQRAAIGHDGELHRKRIGRRMMPAARNGHRAYRGYQNCAKIQSTPRGRSSYPEAVTASGLPKRCRQKSISWISRSNTPPPLCAGSVSQALQAGAAQRRRKMAARTGPSRPERGYPRPRGTAE